MAKEYIERGALIDRFDYYRECFVTEHDYDLAVTTVDGAAIEDDVVEVVRCKDCSWFIAREEGTGDCDMIFGFTSPVSENGYCYCGKRKDGADNAAD